MKDLVRSTWILFETQVKRLCSSKRALLVGLLSLAPVAVSLFVLQVRPEDELRAPIASILWMIMAQIVMPIGALIFGAAIISEEVEDRTVTYLFTRPIPRPALLLGRWFSAWALMAGMFFVSVCSAAWILAQAFPESTGAANPFAWSVPLVLVLIVGSGVYSMLFALVGVLLKRPMILGLAYVFAFENLLLLFPMVPGQIGSMTIQYHLRGLVAGIGGEVWEKADVIRRVELESGLDAGITLFFILAFAGSFGVWILNKRQFELTA